MPARNLLRKMVVPIALAGAMIAGPALPASALHNPNLECGWHWWKGPWHVQQLIRCAADLHGVNVATALRVADCESDFRPGLYYSGNAGVYQHRIKYWPGRADAYGFSGWSPYNGRANIFVTMRMVKVTGWSPWSCY